MRSKIDLWGRAMAHGLLSAIIMFGMSMLFYSDMELAVSTGIAYGMGRCFGIVDGVWWFRE